MGLYTDVVYNVKKFPLKRYTIKTLRQLIPLQKKIWMEERK